MLWIATGAVAVNNTSAIFATCDFVADWANQLCRETQAIEAFSFLAWLTRMSLFLFAYIRSTLSLLALPQPLTPSLPQPK